MTQSQIDLIVANAPKLRAAGVLSLSIDGQSATFAPHEVDPGPATTDADADPVIEHSDPLMDPDTYPGGKVPTFDRSKPDDE